MFQWRTTIQDLMAASFWRGIVYTRRRWVLSAALLLIAALLGWGGGWLIAKIGPLFTVLLALASGLAIWAVLDIRVAYLGVIGVITLLPFASLPYKIGFKPTFLDLALGALFLAWLLPYFLGEARSFKLTAVGVPVLAFAGLAVLTFAVGVMHSSLNSYLLRHFAEIVLAIFTFYLVVNSIQDAELLAVVVRWLILGAVAASVLGIVLYVMPDRLAIQALSALGRVGYPTGSGVLRYIRDDPSLMKRATSTSVDPNVLGSLLNVTLAITLPQLFAKRPLFPRWLTAVFFGVMALALALTVSRGSAFGLAVAAMVLAVVRYRRLLPWMAVAVVVLLLLPWSQAYVAHFIAGLQGHDLSTQMRFGEYKDALRLIRRYPVLGVGFSGAPDIDIYVGVADVYMMIAEQMGLLGLTVFLIAVGTLLVRFWRYRSRMARWPDLEPLWYGVHAAVIGGLVGGIFDRYFFSLDFPHSVTLFWLILGLAVAAEELSSPPERSIITESLKGVPTTNADP